MRFTRPFATADSAHATGRLTTGDDVMKQADTVHCDVELLEGQTHLVLFALNPTQDALSYHGGARGYVSIDLIPRHDSNPVLYITTSTVFDLKAVAWLQELERPDKVQRAFIQIVRMLEQVRFVLGRSPPPLHNGRKTPVRRHANFGPRKARARGDMGGG